MIIFWQKGNRFLGWLYLVIATVAGYGLFQELLSGTGKDTFYGFVGVALFALLSWYCFKPVRK